MPQYAPASAESVNARSSPSKTATVSSSAPVHSSTKRRGDGRKFISTVSSGNMRAVVKMCDAGVGSTEPASSIARIRNW